MLVIGGNHPQAVAARGRVVELGGSAAVNLTGSVTDVLLLPGGEGDRRMTRVAALELPVHTPERLSPAALSSGGVPAPLPAGPGGRPVDPAVVLPRGGVIDLPRTLPDTSWTLVASRALPEAEGTGGPAVGVDVMVLIVDDTGRVRRDEDLVFWNAPENPGGSVRLAVDGPVEQSVTVVPEGLTAEARRLVVAAAVDGGATFGEVGAIEISLGDTATGVPLLRATLDAADSERVLVLAEIYRRGTGWRCRAVGQGHDHGPVELLRAHGVDIEG
ncbi:TerD family protein [Streptomyces sp. ST2-7A]|uniref:TerD family protein n=1 Tax=Streptomyces sp. ST2-7A TaxID=2907214 RepID=UPI0027E23830|nr:TerD family protein [Streptomyces sp. ST2-7A]